MNDKPKKLSTESYKGVRDFFPSDMAIEKHIFDIWRTTVEKYGYEEYGASVLEPAELYKAKSGEEIVNEQTYTFIDRGDREVTLRPEMTPTLARMVAARRRELTYPVRWYSIPNLFRYEQPQRGRVREHWQLNVDIFGVESINAEIEVISIASDITKAYGLKDNQFEIRINNRTVMNYVTREVFNLDESSAHTISKLIDKKDKISPEAFEEGIKIVFGVSDRTNVNGGSMLETDYQNKKIQVKKLITLLNSKNFEEFTTNLPQTKEEHVGLAEIRSVITGLEKLGITNARFDQTLMRGFDYYTGIVFEVFDLNPLNRRSVFGGGRYDDLLSLFGNDKVPAVGFGAGDVVAQDLMETYGTLPHTTPSADIALVTIGAHNTSYSFKIATLLREHSLRVAVNISNKKISDQMTATDKRGIPFVIVLGDTESQTGSFRIKNMHTGEEKTFTETTITDAVSYIKMI